MLIVISPAKALDFKTLPEPRQFTIPEMLDKSGKLVDFLKKMSPVEISKLMGVSNLAKTVYSRKCQTGGVGF